MKLKTESFLFSEKNLDEFIEKINEYEWVEGELTDEEWLKVYGDKDVLNGNVVVDEGMTEDSVVALQALGYKRKDAERYMKDAITSGAGSVEEVIKYALKQAQRDKKLSS